MCVCSRGMRETCELQRDVCARRGGRRVCCRKSRERRDRKSFVDVRAQECFREAAAALNVPERKSAKKKKKVSREILC